MVCSAPSHECASRVWTSIVPTESHPWDSAFKIYEWVWDNIKGVKGKYTSVDLAIKNRVGDCEERACTFIALCRANGIPARQVWIPGHVWAEIALHDHDGVWHWIPIHTAAYNWFGWTGAHEVILQKGDRIMVPIRNRKLRLVDDWYQIKGPAPKTKFTASIKPVSTNGAAAGPGDRKKLANGMWELADSYTSSRYSRGH